MMCETKICPNDVAEKMDLINSLDHDSLATIFMMLPVGDRLAVKKVCPKWEEACQLAWYDIKKYSFGEPAGRVYEKRLLAPSFVKAALSNCGVYLKEVKLSEICSSNLLPIISQSCKNVTNLALAITEKTKINTYDCNKAFENMAKLQFIKIDVSITPDSQQDTKFKSKVLSHLTEEMREIHLMYKGEGHRRPINFNLKKFTKLQKLTLSGCNVDDMIGVISQHESLVYLNLKDSLVTEKCKYKDVNMFNKLVNLEHITITDDWHISAPNLPATIFNTCQNIKHFDVTLWPKDDSAEVISMDNCHNIKNLEYLTIRWKITLRIALQMVECCKNLKHLDILSNEVSESALIKLTELENLEYLVLPRVEELSDNTIMAFLKNCKKLKHLDMPNCINNENDDDDDDEPVVPMVIFNELSNLQHLEHLNLSGMDDLPESSIIGITNKCKNMTYLDLSFCGNLSEAALMSITNLEKLQTLNITGVEDVKNEFIMKLKGLNFFACCGCDQVTDAGLIQLINNCPDLGHLYLYSINLTIDTIIAADKATKDRVNNIILSIYFLNEDVKKASKSIIKSNNWLTLTS